MTARIRAAIITEDDPLDPRTWSGSSASIVAALAPHLDLVHVERKPLSRGASLLQRAARRLSGGRVELGWSVPFFSLATRAARRRIHAAGAEVVVVISSSPVAVVCAREWPVVLIADATGAAMVGYYPEFAAMPGRARRRIVEISSAAIRAARLVTFPSRWACASAIRDAGAAPDAVREIAWGPNLDPLPHGRAREPGSPLRLLFVGIGWERKGGALAAAAVRALRARGIAAELDIAGCERPSGERAEPFIRFHGRLDKRRAEDAARLASLYDEAHLFILPTRAECWGMVFVEAAVFGLPVISTDTGGVPSVVRHGETGVLVPLEASGEDIADAVAALAADPAAYRAMSRAALAGVADRLNWKVWGEALAAEIAARVR